MVLKYKGTWKEVALNRHSKSLTRDIYPFIINVVNEAFGMSDGLTVTD